MKSPYSSAVCSRRLVRRHETSRRSPSNTPIFVLVFPTSATSSIRASSWFIGAPGGGPSPRGPAAHTALPPLSPHVRAGGVVELTAPATTRLIVPPTSMSSAPSVSRSVAIPVTASTVTRRPRVSLSRRHPSRTGAKPSPSRRARQASNSSSRAVSTASRLGARPVSSATDVALAARSGGKSRWPRLMPIPMTVTTSGRPGPSGPLRDSQRDSSKIPASFRSAHEDVVRPLEPRVDAGDATKRLGGGHRGRERQGGQQRLRQARADDDRGQQARAGRRPPGPPPAVLDPPAAGRRPPPCDRRRRARRA